MNSNHRNAPPAPTARCRAIAALLPLLDAPDTDAASSAEARAHLSDCAYCQAQRAAYRRLEVAARRYLAPPAVPRYRAEDIMSDILGEIPAPPVTGQVHPPLTPVPAPNLPPALSRPRRFLSGLAALAAVLVIAIIAASLFYARAHSPVTVTGTAPYMSGKAIDGVGCDDLQQIAVHYHAHLAISINGQPQLIPPDVGRQSATQCLYWLHTHAEPDNGIIHIEAPSEKAFSLYQFFDIWGQPFTRSNLMGHPIDAQHPLTVYVYTPTPDQQNQWNPEQPFTVTPPGSLQPYTGNPRQIVFKAHQLIYLEYGTPVVQPPAFTFAAGE